jgi:hypothetical protein
MSNRLPERGNVEGPGDFAVTLPRFTVTARWSNGNGQTDELGFADTRDELDALKVSLDGLAVGDSITIARIA